MNNLGSDIIIKKQFQLEELHIYGSSRHGIYKPKTMLLQNTYRFNNLDSAIDSTQYLQNTHYFKRTLTLKQYELTNHLGNVLATVLDRKTFVQDSTGADTLLYYKADVSTATLYYAFGSAIQEMSYSSDTSNKYRYDFNGKESDEESDLQDNGMRIYNPSICKFLSVDPLTKSYPMLTPYQFASNTPIVAIDLDGSEAEINYCSLIALWVGDNILRPVASGFVTVTSTVVCNMANQTNVIYKEGIHEGAAYNSNNNVFAYGTYKLDKEWNIVPLNGLNNFIGSLSFEAGKELMESTLTVFTTVIPVETIVAKAFSPTYKYLVGKSLTLTSKAATKLFGGATISLVRNKTTIILGKIADINIV